MKKIAIIPARSGSKGLKDKNILDVCGKPLMAYSIDAAITSGKFEKVIVSTDSKEYGLIASQYGADVMYRGLELSDDKASTYMVIEDMMNRLDLEFDYFVLLQPTSPMRTYKHIIEAIQLFEQNVDKFDFLVSVKEAEYAQILVKPIAEDGSMKYFDTDFSNYKRQVYNDYSPNGAIFIGKRQAYLNQKHFFGAKSLAYRMSALDSVDIDNRLDYEFACLCMKKRIDGLEE